jgi:hypothetical protein
MPQLAPGGVNTRQATVLLYWAAAAREAFCCVVALCCVAIANLTPVAAQPSPTTFSDAVQVLAREQSAAEQYATILIKFGNNDASYRKGIALYSAAKADFDGLIETLKADLIQGRDPSKSRNLDNKLRLAAEKRIAFTSFVDDKIVGMGAFASCGHGAASTWTEMGQNPPPVLQKMSGALRLDTRPVPMPPRLR